MSVNLITGNLFSPIQASQDSDYQAGTFGEKTQILNVGSKMAVSIVDNSTIRCEDGVLVTREGRRVQIDNGDVVEWTIPTGTQGTTSYYIVGFRLYTDDESAQLCDTFVQSVSGPGQQSQKTHSEMERLKSLYLLREWCRAESHWAQFSH